MGALRMFLFCLVSSMTSALPPGKLPNGELHRYTTNHLSPSSDLKSVQKLEAALVARHWMNNIVAQPTVLPEDENIVNRIGRLCEFAEQDEDPRNVYLIWVPAGVMQNVLFIVLVHVEGDRVVPRFLVPSPFWESSQIGSYKLKRALQHLANEANRELDLEWLYENDPRYKLAWKNWGDE